MTKEVPLPFRYGLWRIIMKGWEDFFSNITFKVMKLGPVDGNEIGEFSRRWRVPMYI